MLQTTSTAASQRLLGDTILMFVFSWYGETGMQWVKGHNRNAV